MKCPLCDESLVENYVLLATSPNGEGFYAHADCIKGALAGLKDAFEVMGDVFENIRQGAIRFGEAYAAAQDRTI